MRARSRNWQGDASFHGSITPLVFGRRPRPRWAAGIPNNASAGLRVLICDSVSARLPTAEGTGACLSRTKPTQKRRPLARMPSQENIPGHQRRKFAGLFGGGLRWVHAPWDSGASRQVNWSADFIPPTAYHQLGDLPEGRKAAWFFILPPVPSGLALKKGPSKLTYADAACAGDRRTVDHPALQHQVVKGSRQRDWDSLLGAQQVKHKRRIGLNSLGSHRRIWYDFPIEKEDPGFFPRSWPGPARPPGLPNPHSAPPHGGLSSHEEVAMCARFAGKLRSKPLKGGRGKPD